MNKTLFVLGALALFVLVAPASSAATDEGSSCGGVYGIVGCAASDFCSLDIQFAEPGPQYKCAPEYQS